MADSENKVELAVLGGGPGGYVAALRAANLGGRVALIEKEGLGGVCTHKGCIPTKALLNTVDLLDKLKHSSLHGIVVEKYSIEFPETMKRVQRIVNRLEKGVEYLLDKAGVTLLRGVGYLKSPGVVHVTLEDGGGEDVKYQRLIVATGSHPFKIPIPGVDGRGVITSDEIFKLTEVPESLIVVGGGAVGIEFATMMNGLGSEVSLVEMMPQLMPGEDRYAGSLLRQILERKGVKVQVGARVDGIKDEGDLKLVEASRGSEKLSLKAELILLASGRIPNTGGLGLENLNIALTDNGFISVGDRMETNVQGIYAVGDVAGKFLLAHTAMQEGLVAAENVMGGDAVINYKGVPRCVYSQPEAAFVGLSEELAREKYGEVETAEFPLIANGRAITLGCHNGAFKIVYEKRFKELLGATIVAPEASELIHELALVLQVEATLDDLAGMIHAHPTLSESLREVALRATGKPIHG